MLRYDSSIAVSTHAPAWATTASRASDETSVSFSFNPSVRKSRMSSFTDVRSTPASTT